jgi:hypothetical protein
MRLPLRIVFPAYQKWSPAPVRFGANDLKSWRKTFVRLLATRLFADFPLVLFPVKIVMSHDALSTDAKSVLR